MRRPMSAFPPKATLNASIRISSPSTARTTQCYALAVRKRACTGASMKTATAFLASIISVALSAAAAMAADAPPQVASNLEEEDMLAIVAYLASLDP